MSWSIEQRLQFVNRLGEIRRVLVAIYCFLLGLVIAAILVVSVWVFVWRPLGVGNQGEYFYFAMGALLGIGCCVGKLVQLARRERRWQLPNIMVRTTESERGRAWEFRLGPAGGEPSDGDETPVTLSKTFSIPLARLATELLPDEAALTCLERELARGASLEDACRMVQPAYEDWGTLQRRAYQMYVNSILAERRRS